jgi:hypothetical protein
LDDVVKATVNLQEVQCTQRALRVLQHPCIDVSDCGKALDRSGRNGSARVVLAYCCHNALKHRERVVVVVVVNMRAVSIRRRVVAAKEAIEISPPPF